MLNSKYLLTYIRVIVLSRIDNGPEERELQITEVGLVNFFNHSDVTFNFTNGHSEKTIWGGELKDVNYQFKLNDILMMLCVYRRYN